MDTPHIVEIDSEGMVTMKSAGNIMITATQLGNEYYSAAEAVVREVNITQGDVSLLGLQVNGRVWNIEERFVPDCDVQTVTINVATEANARVYMDGKPIDSKEIIIETNKLSVQKVKFAIKSQDGTLSSNYELEIEKRFAFDDLVIQRWNNTLLINNNAATNGGWVFTAFRWFKNGEEIGNEQYYSAGIKKTDLLYQSAEYYFQATTQDGEVLRSCPSLITLQRMDIKVYPGIVNQGESIFVEADVNEDQLQNAQISIYNINGLIVSTQKATDKVTTIPAPTTSGLYIVRIQTGDIVKSVKIMVK